MKKYFLIFLLSLAFFGCTSDDLVLKDTELEFSSQKWILVEMTGSWVNHSTKGDDMEWQEYYIFNPDGSFFKSREQDGMVSEATGTFEMVEFDNDDADYLELTFDTGKELVAGCYGYGGMETLRYISDKKLQSMWMACDGPGLYYVLEQD